MIPVLSERESKELDRTTIQSDVKSGFELMKSAGKGVAVWFAENIENPFRQIVLVVAGKGNNGGDGIVAHYYLRRFGISSTLLLMDENEIERGLLKDYEIPVHSIKIYNESENIPSHDWIIDALFGIGLKREITGKYRSLILSINNSDKVISVDIPSGVYTDTGLTAGVSVKSRFTITMGYEKMGHYLNDGGDCCGKINVLDIGFAPIKHTDYQVHKVIRSDIKQLIKTPVHNIHKYSKGCLSIIAGSTGMSGAAVLSSQGAIKSGCGIVKLFIPQAISTEFNCQVPEVITIPFDPGETFNHADDLFDEISEEIYQNGAVLIGPGLGVSTESTALVTKLLTSLHNPTVIDASGFEPLISGELSFIDLPEECVLTPHIGEFSRLFKINKDDVVRDPVSSLINIRGIIGNRVIILKGSPTFITQGSGKVIIIKNGLPILATAGTGDVLAGMISSYLAQGYPILDASIIATYIHAEVSQYFSDQYGDYGISASDIPNGIKLVMDRILHEY